MRAVGFYPEETELRVVERDRPSPDEGEVLVRTLYVGVDGSDRRIAAGEIGGEPPEGDDYLVVGHEAVGVVEDSNGTGLAEGAVVVPLVRRPISEGSTAVRNEELDMALPGSFHECGIVGAHGYMTEYFTCAPEYLVEVPDSRAEYGVLVEPASLVEKALEQAFASRSAFEWRPETAFVLGNGNLGLLALARLATGDEFDRIYCLGRRDRPDPTVDFIEAVGGTYVDSRETPVEEFARVHEPADYVFETTGYPRHAVEAVHALGPNGVATLQGIPGPATFDVEGGEFHSELVTANKALLGVVNSRRSHFRAAAEWLRDAPESPLDTLVNDVYSVDEARGAFEDSPEALKTIVSFV